MWDILPVRLSLSAMVGVALAWWVVVPKPDYKKLDVLAEISRKADEVGMSRSFLRAMVLKGSFGARHQYYRSDMRHRATIWLEQHKQNWDQVKKDENLIKYLEICEGQNPLELNSEARARKNVVQRGIMAAHNYAVKHLALGVHLPLRE